MEIKQGKLMVRKVITIFTLTATAAMWFPVAGLAGPGTDYEKIGFERDKARIQKDLEEIAYHKAEIKVLKTKIKKEKLDDNAAEVVMYRKILRKAKADLKKGKAYLRADKCDLKQDHKLAIREKKAIIKEDKKDIRAGEKQLREDIEKPANNLTVATSASSVAEKQRKLKNDLAILKDAKREMRSDMVAVNKQIREGRDGIPTYVETAYNRVENWFR